MVRADKRKFHYIYKITRNNSDRYYIGMHSTDRMDDGYFGSGSRLWKSINKYGKENHTMEILEFCESREQLKIREKEIIGDLWKLDEECMNLKGGGEGGGGFFSEEHRRKFAEAAGNSNAWRSSFNKGLGLWSKEAQNKAAQTKRERYASGELVGSFCGKRHSDATKNKMSTSMQGKQSGSRNSQFGSIWISNLDTKEIKKLSANTPIPDGWCRGRKK